MLGNWYINSVSNNNLIEQNVYYLEKSGKLEIFGRLFLSLEIRYFYGILLDFNWKIFEILLLNEIVSFLKHH